MHQFSPHFSRRSSYQNWIRQCKICHIELSDYNDIHCFECQQYLIDKDNYIHTGNGFTGRKFIDIYTYDKPFVEHIAKNIFNDGVYRRFTHYICYK